MKIDDKSVVSLDYSLHLGDGEVIDETEAGEPLVYLHGVGQLVPGLERELEGMEPGQSKQVVVPAADAYGMRDDTKVRTIPMASFGGEQVVAGDEFIAVDDDDNEVPVKILKVEGPNVTADFNHPLAGETLHFKITVRDVRLATEEELEHGHVHDGSDGHHH